MMLLLLSLLVSLILSSSYYLSTKVSRRTLLHMGLGDMFKNALANDPNLPPAKNPGLSKEPVAVEVEFLPSNKKVKAFLGQSISTIAQKSGVDIKYGCKKGECRTCEVNFNGKIVKACQSSLPSTSSLKKFTIGIPPKK